MFLPSLPSPHRRPPYGAVILEPPLSAPSSSLAAVILESPLSPRRRPPPCHPPPCVGIPPAPASPSRRDEWWQPWPSLRWPPPPPRDESRRPPPASSPRPPRRLRPARQVLPAAGSSHRRLPVVPTPASPSTPCAGPDARLALRPSRWPRCMGRPLPLAPAPTAASPPAGPNAHRASGPSRRRLPPPRLFTSPGRP